MNILNNRRMAKSVVAAYRQFFAHDFSCLMSDLPREAADEVYYWGLQNIPDEDLADDGREDQIHVTVKYGIHITDPTKIQEHLANLKPISVTLGKISLFDTDPNHDVVKIEVDSPDLHNLNKLMSKNFEVTDTYPDYKPHITIAYVKKGLGQKYDGWDDFEGKKIILRTVVFSGRDNRMTTLALP